MKLFAAYGKAIRFSTEIDLAGTSSDVCCLGLKDGAERCAANTVLACSNPESASAYKYPSRAEPEDG